MKKLLCLMVVIFNMILISHATLASNFEFIDCSHDYQAGKRKPNSSPEKRFIVHHFLSTVALLHKSIIYDVLVINIYMGRALEF